MLLQGSCPMCRSVTSAEPCVRGCLFSGLQRQQLEADGERLRGEYESLVAAQQERAAEWDAAAKREEAAMAARKQVGRAASCSGQHAPGLCYGRFCCTLSGLPAMPVLTSGCPIPRTATGAGVPRGSPAAPHRGAGGCGAPHRRCPAAPGRRDGAAEAGCGRCRGGRRCTQGTLQKRGQELQRAGCRLLPSLADRVACCSSFALRSLPGALFRCCHQHISPACLFCDVQEREQELAAREDQLEAWKAQFKAEAVRQVGPAAAALAASRITCHLSTG